MSDNAEAVATAIATYLVENGCIEIADQIYEIRATCGRYWKILLSVGNGFDGIERMTDTEMADGLDVALARLVDAAQEVYDLCGISQQPYDDCDRLHEGECAWKCGTCGCNWATCGCDGSTIMATPTAVGKTQPAAHYLRAVNTPVTGGQ